MMDTTNHNTKSLKETILGPCTLFNFDSKVAKINVFYITFLQKFSDLLKSDSVFGQKTLDKRFVSEVKAFRDVITNLDEKTLAAALQVLKKGRKFMSDNANQNKIQPSIRKMISYNFSIRGTTIFMLWLAFGDTSHQKI